MENNKSSGGIGFVGLLQIAFIILKLCKVIAWSWVWVMAPTWISVIIVAVLTVILILLERKDNDE